MLSASTENLLLMREEAHRKFLSDTSVTETHTDRVTEYRRDTESRCNNGGGALVSSAALSSRRSASILDLDAIINCTDDPYNAVYQLQQTSHSEIHKTSPKRAELTPPNHISPRPSYHPENGGFHRDGPPASPKCQEPETLQEENMSLRRENRLLQAALMAVLRTGGRLNGCPCGISEKGHIEMREGGHAGGRVVEESSLDGLSYREAEDNALDVYFGTRLGSETMLSLPAS